MFEFTQTTVYMDLFYQACFYNQDVKRNQSPDIQEAIG